MSWEQEVVAEKMAFMMCDSDKMVGLTWREVESCIQRYAGLLEDNRASNESLRKFYNPGEGPPLIGPSLGSHLKHY